MAKYIDAEKLTKKIDLYYDHYRLLWKNGGSTYESGLADGLDVAEQIIDSLQEEQHALPDNLDEAAEEQTRSFGYQKEDYEYKELIETFKAGADFAVQQVLSLIESRIAEILGDAQPAPILRAELLGLIDKIKEESK